MCIKSCFFKCPTESKQTECSDILDCLPLNIIVQIILISKPVINKNKHISSFFQILMVASTFRLNCILRVNTIAWIIDRLANNFNMRGALAWIYCTDLFKRNRVHCWMTAVKQVNSRLKRKELMEVNSGTKVQGLKMWQEWAVSC